MRKIKKLLMTFGIAGALAIGVGATVATQNSNPKRADAATSNEILTFAMNQNSLTGSPVTLKAKEDSTKTLSVSYSGLTDKSSYIMFNQNSGYAYSSSIIDGYYVNSLTTSYTGQTSKDGLVDHIYSSAENTTRKNPCTTKVSKNGKTSTSNANAANLYWNVSTSKKNVQIEELIVTYKKSKGSPTSVQIVNGDTLTITSGSLGEKLSTQLIADVTYASGESDNNATWSTVSPIASVTADGWMTFTENGTATFTAKAGNFSDSITVTVSNLLEVVTVSKTVEELKTELNWAVNSSYPAFALNNTINVSLTGDGSGKYTIHNKTIHQLDVVSGGDITVTAKEGYQIDNVKLTLYPDSGSVNAPDGTGYTSGSTYAPTTAVGSVTFTTTAKTKLQGLSVKYSKNEALVSNGIAVEFASGKTGQYLASNLKDNAFSTADLKVLVKCGDQVLSTIDSGLGFKVTITNGTKVVNLDATSSVVEQKFFDFEPGDYTLTVTYVNAGGTTLTSAGITLKINPLATDTITITQQPKLAYASFFEKYTEFEGGAIEAVRNDGSKTSTLSKFAFQYIVNGLEKQLSDITDVNGYFTFTEPTDITVNAYLKEFGSTSKAATYTVKVTPATTITAVNADVDTVYYTNIDYPMSANVTTVINGTTYNIPASDITITPATLNVASAGTHTITVSYNKIPTVTTTFTVEVKAPKGIPTMFLYYGESFDFTAGDAFKVPALNPYATVNYENDPADYDITSLDNIKFYLSINEEYEADIDQEITEGTILKYYDNNYKIIPVYTEGATSIASLSVPLTVNEKALPTYITPTLGDKYIKITDASELHDGDKIVLVGTKNDSTLQISTGFSTDGEILEASAVTLAADSSIAYKGTTPITIAKENDVYQLSVDGKLIANSGSYLAPNGAADTWTLEKTTDGNFKFKNVTNSTQILQFNAQSPRFKTYTSGQKGFDIYVLNSIKGSDPAQYIIDLIDTMRLNAAEFIEGEGFSVCDLLNNQTFQTAWTNAKDAYNANKDNALFLAKLNVVDKYSDGVTTYAQTVQHLMNIDPNGSISPANYAFDNETGTIMLIVGISIVGVSSIAAFGLIARRKTKNN